jgi:hypothetical protein
VFQISPFLLLKGHQSLDLGPTLNPGWSNLEIFNLVTSAKTLFPNKVTAIDTGVKTRP